VRRDPGEDRKAVEDGKPQAVREVRFLPGEHGTVILIVDEDARGEAQVKRDGQKGQEYAPSRSRVFDRGDEREQNERPQQRPGIGGIAYLHETLRGRRRTTFSSIRMRRIVRIRPFAYGSGFGETHA
jgi:hypothetical protein